jgi:hypothetical protein
MALHRILYVTPFRRRARRIERALQEALDALHRGPGKPTLQQQGMLDEYAMPHWAHGVRVDHAGPFQHAIVATEHRGH